MLNMGNTTSMIQTEAEKFNEVLVKYQRRFENPLLQYTVSPNVLFVEPLKCGLE